MVSRFRREHDSTGRSRWPLIAGVVVTLLAVGGLGLGVRATPRVPQPVPFNHLKHTADLSLPCSFCHKYVQTGAHAGLPDATTCAICHTTPQGTSEAAARVTELIEAGDPLYFNKLFRLPDHVFYTHRRHAGVAQLECTNCHGEIAQTERPPSRALITITMDFCMDCHRERGQNLDCTACHR